MISWIKLGIVCVLATMSVEAEIRVPEFRRVDPDRAGEAMFLGADGRAVADKFKVSEVMNSKVFGQMDKADDRFVKNAASAVLEIKDGSLVVDIDCPVPKGMTAKKVDEPWNGDRVELLIRPKLDVDEVAVFAANCGGPYAAHGFREGVRNMGWSSSSRISVTNDVAGFRVHMVIPVKDAFNKVPEPGDVFGVNIQRLGPTCGRHSAWAKNGGAFNTSRWVFGTLIVGGTGEYFRRRLAGYAERFSKLADRSMVQKVAGAVQAAIDAHADDPGAYAALDAMFRELDQALVALALKDYPVLIYEAADAWGNRPEPTTGTKPLAKIALKAPRSTLRIKAFALANLTDADFLGNLKVLAAPNRFYSRTRDLDRPQPTIADAFTIRRGVWGQLKNGQPNADATVELPFGSLVELGPGKVVPIYLELDTHGLAAGTHQLWLGLESATQGIPGVRIPIEVTITEDDLDSVDLPRLAYTHLHASCRRGHRPLANCVRELVKRGYNDVFISRFDDLYPRRDATGEWVASDYADIDRWIDLWIAGGLPAEKMYVRPFIAVERSDAKTRYAALWRGLRDAENRLVPFATPEYEKGMRVLLTAFTKHVTEKYGIRQERIIWYPVDEANGKLEDPTFKSSLSRCRWMGRFIKEVDPRNFTMWNPLPNFLASDEFAKAAPELTRYFDFMMPYRPKLTPKAIDIIRKSGARRVGTYHISSFQSMAVAYRKGTWQNLRDGFLPIESYWHMDESGYFAGAEHGYGTCIVDWDLDRIAFTRRQLASDMAYQEGRLVIYLKRKFAADPAKLAQIDALVKAAADTATMPAMDQALEALLNLL